MRRVVNRFQINDHFKFMHNGGYEFQRLITSQTGQEVIIQARILSFDLYTFEPYFEHKNPITDLHRICTADNPKRPLRFQVNRLA
jgi:hypothetical protein